MADTHGFDVVIAATAPVLRKALRGAWKSAECADGGEGGTRRRADPAVPPDSGRAQPRRPDHLGRPTGDPPGPTRRRAGARDRRLPAALRRDRPGDHRRPAGPLRPTDRPHRHRPGRDADRSAAGLPRCRHPVRRTAQQRGRRDRHQRRPARPQTRPDPRRVRPPRLLQRRSGWPDPPRRADHPARAGRHRAEALLRRRRLHPRHPSGDLRRPEPARAPDRGEPTRPRARADQPPQLPADVPHRRHRAGSRAHRPDGRRGTPGHPRRAGDTAGGVHAALRHRDGDRRSDRSGTRTAGHQLHDQQQQPVRTPRNRAAYPPRSAGHGTGPGLRAAYRAGADRRPDRDDDRQPVPRRPGRSRFPGALDAGGRRRGVRGAGRGHPGRHRPADHRGQRRPRRGHRRDRPVGAGRPGVRHRADRTDRAAATSRRPGRRTAGPPPTCPGGSDRTTPGPTYANSTCP